MSEALKTAVVHLEQVPALKLADDSRVHGKFVQLYDAIHGKNRGAMAFEMEKFHFQKQLTENPALQSCTKLSLYGAFMDVAVQGLSLDPTKKLCYLLPYNVNAGTKDNPKWEKRCQLSISPYGELYLRQYYGQIKTADNPEVVFEGEKFTITTDRNGKFVNHEITYPRPTGKIIAVYFRFVKADGNVDYGILDSADMERLRGYSERKNNGKANALYGAGDKGADKGFFIAKCIKHAFRAYPKVRLKGQFSQMETDAIENDDVIDYGMDEAPEVVINPTTTDTARMTTTVDENSGEVITVEDELDF